MAEPQTAPPPEPPDPTPIGTPQAPYREVTVAAVVFAIVIGIVMNAAITYAGLKIGFTITGSAIAAVLGFGVLRGVLKKGSILETNIAQTVASAVNIPNSGIIFTVPVLFLLGYQLTAGSTDFWMIALATIAGAFLGTAFIIPLRKQMLDIERLRFPSSTAVASILKSPGAGAAKAVVLGVGVVVGALIFLPTQLPTFGLPGPAALAAPRRRQRRLRHRHDARPRPALRPPGAVPAHLRDRAVRPRRGLPDRAAPGCSCSRAACSRTSSSRPSRSRSGGCRRR